MWSFLGTAVLLGIIGYFLGDFLRVQYGYFGTLVWVGVFITAFFFGLVHYAQFVLPMSGVDGWWEGLRLLGRSYFNGLINLRYRLYKVAPRPAQPKRPGTARSGVTPPDWSPSFRFLRAGITQNHEVLALTRGQSFSRAAGPGFVRLYAGEAVARAIDLRPQLRRQDVKTNTRDGIPVETAVTVIFRVRRIQPDDEDVAYPYDPEAIFHVTYAHSTDGRDGLHPWTEQVCPRAAAILEEELAQHRLNDLYQDEATIALLDMIQQKVKRRLEQEAERFGIEVLVVGLGHLQPPDEVMTQRIETWQAEWKRQIKVQQAVGDAEAERRLKNARARAQIEIIHNITQNIDAMRRAGNSNLTQIIMLRMIEALEEATADPVVQLILPQGLIVQLVEEATDQMKDWLLEAGGQPRV